MGDSVNHDAVMNVRKVYVDSSIDNEVQSKLKVAAEACGASIDITKNNIESDLSGIINQKMNTIFKEDDSTENKGFKFVLI